MLEVRRTLGKIVFVSATVLCVGACIVVGCRSRPAGIARLLPSASALDGWRSAGSPEIYEAQSLYDRINGGAEIFFEYGFDQAVYQDYEKGDDYLQVEIYDMVDDTAAFGIYSINRSPRAESVALGGGGQQSGDTVTFWQQQYYVVVRRFGDAEADEGITVEAARDIAGKIGSEAGTVPAAVSLLPTTGKVEGSETVVRGPIALSQIRYLGEEEPLGLARGKEAAVGTYRVADDSVHVLVMKYGSEGELDEAFERTATAFGDQFELVERSETSVTARDMRGKYHGARKTDTVLTVVFGAQSAESAELVFSQIG
jgi:hypothetical protein